MERLKELRQSVKMTQAELAAATGIDIGIIRAYEQGRRNLDGANLKTILRLADALGCTLETLITDQETVELLRKVR